jgi:hypothetical protein
MNWEAFTRIEGEVTARRKRSSVVSERRWKTTDGWGPLSVREGEGARYRFGS